MSIEQVWYFIQEQTLEVQLPKPLLQRRGAVCNDTQNLRHKRLVGSDLAIPALYKLPHDYSKEGVELQVDIIAARERRQQQVLDSGLGISAFVSQLLRAQRPADEVQRCPIRQRGYRHGTGAPTIWGAGFGGRRGGGMFWPR